MLWFFRALGAQINPRPSIAVCCLPVSPWHLNWPSGVKLQVDLHGILAVRPLGIGDHPGAAKETPSCQQRRKQKQHLRNGGTGKSVCWLIRDAHLSSLTKGVAFVDTVVTTVVGSSYAKTIGNRDDTGKNIAPLQDKPARSLYL